MTTRQQRQDKSKQSSITSLLMLGVLSATLIYLLVCSALIYTQIGNTLDTLRNKSLNEQAHQIAELFEKTQNITLKKGQKPNPVYNSADFYQYIVRDVKTGKITLHSPRAYTDSFPALYPDFDQSRSFSFIGLDGQRYLGVAIRQRSGDRDYVIEIAQSEDLVKNFYSILTSTFFQRLSFFGIPFIFVLMLVIAMSIRLIMTPLTKALKEVREISFATPDIRLNDATFPQEIRPLAQAMNDALDRLENGIKAQKDFIANAAHELRTPLSILRAHVDLLEDKVVAERMRGDVDAMARLVSQLLDTARLESPEPFEMHGVDLAEVVKNVSQSIWPLMVKDGRVFEVDGIDRPVPVQGNFDTLCRALRNLLENALKYSPPGSPISIHLDGHAIIVSDNGKGVQEDDKDRIFGKFSRRDMQQGMGAGLGLFIVRRIMTLHGGTVSVENAPQGGRCLHCRSRKARNFMAISAGVVHKLPADLRKGLVAHPNALVAWEDITPLARNEWICWIEFAKKAETRHARIERAYTDLTDGKRRPCCWPGCPHR